MVVYTCHCLNIKIFAEKADDNTRMPDALKSCPLGPSCEAVELINEGFQFAHKRLVQRLRDEDWTIYVCVPCHMKTHGVNSEERLVVVNASMNKGDDKVAAMQSNSDFSRAFKLVLSPAENKPVIDETIPRQSYNTLQKQLGDLQVILSTYLKQEEENMERRIRAYEEEQRNNFQSLKKQCHEDKTKLVSVLFQKSEAGDLSDGDKMDANNAMRHMTLSHSKSSGEYERSSLGAVAASRRNKPSRRLRDSSPDDLLSYPAVFAMDGLDLDEDDRGGEVPPCENLAAPSVSIPAPPPAPSGRWRRSDPANFLTTMDEIEDSAAHRRAGAAAGFAGEDDYEDENDLGAQVRSASHMSTSVPISMPMGARSLRNMPRHLDHEIDEDLSAEFDDIPRQMQALSESIQERDRYIFGDRPRQRVNTGDFTQVKWS